MLKLTLRAIRYKRTYKQTALSIEKLRFKKKLVHKINNMYITYIRHMMICIYVKNETPNNQNKVYQIHTKQGNHIQRT